MSKFASSPSAVTCLCLALVVAGSLPAMADVKVEASGDVVRVVAEGSSLGAVLDALGVTYDPRFLDSGDLGTAVSRTVSGSLPHVLSVLLAGYDYAAVVSESGVVDIRWMMPRSVAAPDASMPPVSTLPPPVAMLPPQVPPGASPPGNPNGPTLLKITPDIESRLRAAGRRKGR